MTGARDLGESSINRYERYPRSAIIKAETKVTGVVWKDNVSSHQWCWHLEALCWTIDGQCTSHTRRPRKGEIQTIHLYYYPLTISNEHIITDEMYKTKWNKACNIIAYNIHPGEGTLILEHGRKVPWWWPPYCGLSIQRGPNFVPQHNPNDPCFLQKKMFCLYHI